MSDTVYKNCRDCGEPIQLSRMPNGNWVAFDRGAGKHECGGSFAPAPTPMPVAAIAASIPSRVSSPPRYRERFETSAQPAGSSIGCVWPILLLMTVVVVLLITWLLG